MPKSLEVIVGPIRTEPCFKTPAVTALSKQGNRIDYHTAELYSGEGLLLERLQRLYDEKYVGHSVVFQPVEFEGSGGLIGGVQVAHVDCHCLAGTPDGVRLDAIIWPRTVRARFVQEG